MKLFEPFSVRVLVRLHSVALSIVFASVAAPAQDTCEHPTDATAFLQQVDAKLHSPWAEMDEFCAEVSMTALFLPGSTIRYLWLKHSTSEVRLEGQPNPAMDHLLNGFLREEVFDKLMRETTFAPMLVQYRDCDLTLARDGDLHRLDVLSHRADTVFQQQTVWFDEQLLPIRYESDNTNEVFGSYHESILVSYEELAGHWVPTFGSSQADNAAVAPVPVETKFEWQQIGEHFVVTDVTMWGIDGDSRTIMFRVGFDDIRINQGFGDPPKPGEMEFLTSSHSQMVSLGTMDGLDGAGNRERLGLSSEETTSLTVIARSFSFSPSLSLRDAGGDLVARTEAAGPTAVLQAEVAEGSVFTLEVSRVDGLRGDVEVWWTPGLSQPEPPNDAVVTDHGARMLSRGRKANECGLFDDAEAYARQVLSMADVHFTQATSLKAEAHLALARSLSGQGLVDEALAASDVAIDILDDLQHPLLLHAPILKAGFLRKAGRLAEARSELESCLAKAEDLRGGLGDLSRLSLNVDLSALILRQGRAAEATEILRKALASSLAIYGEEARLPLLTRSMLADALFQVGQYAEAHEHLAAAVSASLRSRGIHHVVTQTMLRFQALITQAEGNNDLAAERLEDLIDLREATVEGDDPFLLSLLGDLAQVELSRGDLELARELMQRSLAGIGRVYGSESSAMANVLDNLGDLLLAEGRPSEALAHLAESARLRRTHLERELTALTEQQRLRWAGTQRDIVDRLVVHAITLPDTDSAELVYAEVRNWKGLVSRGLLQDRRWLEQDADPDLRALVLRLRRTVSQLSAEALRADWRTIREGEQEFDLDALLAERRDLEERIARRGARETVSTATTLPQIQAGLGQREGLVDLVIVRGERSRRAAAFVTRAEGAVALVDLGDASALNAAVAAHLDGIEAGRDGVRDARGRSHGAPQPAPAKPAAPSLRDLLWEPLQAHLQGVERVFICPEAELATLPFETIAGEVPGTFLIEEHAFVYLQSAADLLAERVPRSETGKIVVLGGVDYSARAQTGPAAEALAETAAEGDQAGAWPQLPGTALEARDIASLSSGLSVELLSGNRATEAALREAVTGARVVHLATHGFFDSGESPSTLAPALDDGTSELATGAGRDVAGLLPGLRSGIVLAGANAPAAENGDDGLLTAEEAAWLDLSACELVVLSACETGLGTPSGGENLIGLRRAFYLAGAESRITSLWKVEDEATRQLMLDFYRRRIDEGLGRSEALRGAQLAMLAEQRSKGGGLALPATWGAFVLEGAWW